MRPIDEVACAAGVNRPTAQAALRRHKGDVAAAVAQLLATAAADPRSFYAAPKGGDEVHRIRQRRAEGFAVGCTLGARSIPRRWWVVLGGRVRQNAPRHEESSSA